MKFKKEKKLKVNTIDRGFDSYDFKLGDLFRGERATLGLSLMDVQRALKINVEIISAIERCEISNDQDSVFIPGYVKSYAKFLNLDPDWVFERFCEETDYKNPSPIRKTKSNSKRNFNFQKSSSIESDSLLNNPLHNSSEPHAQFKIRSMVSIFSIFAILVIFGSGGMYVLNTIQKVIIIEDEKLPIIVEQASNLNNDPDLLLMDNIEKNKELSVFTSRDGPIVDVNPNQNGIFTSESSTLSTDSTSNKSANVIKERKEIHIFASRPAWVRIYTSQGEIIDEEILDFSQTMKIPSNIKSLFLRSGNAGSVFIKVGSESYGPIGEGTGVVKDVSLSYDDIVKNFEVVTDQKLLTPLKRLKIITEKTE